MKANLKRTALAAAVAALAAGAAHAEVNKNVNVNIDHNQETNWVWNKNVNQNYNDNVDRNRTENTTIDHSDSVSHDESYTTTVDRSLDHNVSIDQSLRQSHDLETSKTLTSAANVDFDKRVTESHNFETNRIHENIDRTENVSSDIRRERDEHGVSVNIDKSLSLDSDISFSGDPTISGDIQIDSAAIALIDNRQSNTGNVGVNDMLTNEAAIADDVASEASGNLQFNVAAGDNNVQDNAAALSAADAGFAFGLADAEIFVNQYGAGNTTINRGVTNAASLGGNAFSDASGNIGVNVAAGNNNQQKNALAASVATSAYAQATVSSNQISTGNQVSNEGRIERMTDTTQVTLNGTVSGLSLGVGVGAYEGTSQGSYAGTGNAYQQSNFYSDMWQGELHPQGPVIGHADFDIDSQGAVANPYRAGVGGLAFDTDESGSYEGSESGQLGFVELSYSDLQASLSGTVKSTQWIVVDATNTAGLSGSAFSRASGNIGVNVAAGTGNLQANSLALAVAQPSTGGNGGPPPTE